MKILITGADGLLGTELKKVFSETDHDVSYCSHEYLDITNVPMIRERMRELNPSVLINCAAIIDVDAAQTDGEMSHKINYVGVSNLLDNFHGEHFIQISTASVFGELGVLWPEVDFPFVHPLSTYSTHKALAELEVKMLSTAYTILRIPWLFSGAENDKKFVRKVWEKIRNNEPVKAVSDVEGQLCYAPILADVIKLVVEKEIYGELHVGSWNSCSRYDIACKLEVFKRYNGNELFSASKVSPVSNREFNLPAPRPRKEFISVEKTEKILDYKFPSWQEMLELAYHENLK